MPKAHSLLKSRIAELSIALVGDARMAALHQQFLGIPGPTDVLTFPLDHDSHGRITAGEVIICIPQAIRQAQQRGIALHREVLLYALHGLLHLGGFDDTTDSAFRTMHAMEDKILIRLGLGPVFSLEPSTRKGARRKPSRPAVRSANRRKLGA